MSYIPKNVASCLNVLPLKESKMEKIFTTFIWSGFSDSEDGTGTWDLPGGDRISIKCNSFREANEIDKSLTKAFTAAIEEEKKNLLRKIQSLF